MLPRIGRQNFSHPTQAPIAGPAAKSVFDTDGFELVPLPASAHLRQSEGSTNFQGYPTLLQPLPGAPGAPRAHDSKRFRRVVGGVQIQQAHDQYVDNWGAQLLAARPSVVDDGLSRKKERMAENAGRALVRLQPQGLVSMKLTEDIAQARAIVKALRKAGILDGHNQVSRGAERSVDNSELANAVRALELTNPQEAALCDVVVVLKFLYDFGIREAESLFDFQVCCSDWGTYKRPSTWTEFGSAVAHLFDAKQDDGWRAQLQATRAALSV